MKMAMAILSVMMATATLRATGQSTAAELRKLLPEGWSLTLIDEHGKMGHAHGMEEPLFRIDFVNTNVVIKEEQHVFGTNVISLMHPNLRLHFHSQAERDNTLAIIQKEMVYSWDIPMLFGETRDFMIIGSPAWYNQSKAGADHGDEANRAMASLLRVLRSYMDANKEKSRNRVPAFL